MAQTASGPETAAAHANGEARPRESFLALTVGSIGVVYGDIGTSPLYAFREAVVAASGEGGPVTREAVLGVLSLISVVADRRRHAQIRADPAAGG